MPAGDSKRNHVCLPCGSGSYSARTTHCSGSGGGTRRIYLPVRTCCSWTHPFFLGTTRHAIRASGALPSARKRWRTAANTWPCSRGARYLSFPSMRSSTYSGCATSACGAHGDVAAAAAHLLARDPVRAGIATRAGTAPATVAADAVATAERPSPRPRRWRPRPPRPRPRPLEATIVLDMSRRSEAVVVASTVGAFELPPISMYRTVGRDAVVGPTSIAAVK